MQLSQIPTKIPTPWAKNAGGDFIRAIPQASQIGITAGAASWPDGFVPVNFLPVGSGGTPPFGQDMNGVLNALSLWSQWTGAGGVPQYDSAFAAAIGGYPRGAILASTTTGIVWLNLADNNATNPDSGGTNWITLGFTHGSQTYGAAGTFTFTVPSGVFLIKVRLWGAGGGSGGTNGTDSGAMAGAGGGYSEGYISVTPGQTVTVTVGAGGTGGATTPTNGGTGGTTSFGAFMSATGGAGGIGSSTGTVQETNVAAGGVGTGGSEMNLSGCTSDAAVRISTGRIIVGVGGASWGGLKAHSGVSESASTSGVAGFFPGGGASASANQGNGAAGAAGQVIVNW